MSTICALSTPNAVGGIAVIRISGSRAIEIADGIFVPFGSTPVREMAGHTCAYGKIVDGEKTVDDVLLTVFRAPKSYTGEDIVEISCHGGVYVSKKIIRLLLSLGCEPATAGEFTKRAFLNGKLNLTQEEGVADSVEDYVADILPPQWQSHGQSLMHLFPNCFAPAIVSLLAGVVLDHWGVNTALSGMLVCTLIGAALVWLATRKKK